MKFFRHTLGLIGLAMLAGVATAGTLELPPVFGMVPGRSVSKWIKYVVVGPSNSPFPIVFISPHKFKTGGFPESLTVLPRSRYDIVADFTRARTARSDCKATKRKVAAWYTVEISEHADGKTRRCVLRQEPACRYLSGVLRLPGVDWTTEERKPINDLMRSIKCKSA